MSKKRNVYQQGGNIYQNAGITTTGFIPTYAGAPVEELMQTSQNLQNQYHTNLADATKMDILNAERRAIAGDDPLNQEISLDYQKELDAIAEAGDYENMGTRVNALAKKYARDKRIQTITDTKKAFDAEEELAQKLRLQGINPLFAGDATAYKSVSVNPETKEVTYNPYTSRLTAELDYDAKKKEIASQINPDAYITNLTERERATIANNPMAIFAIANYKGISTNKVQQLKGEMLNVYLDSKEGKQEVEALKFAGYEDDEIIDVIGNSLESRGNIRTFFNRDVDVPNAGKTSTGSAVDPTTGEQFITLSPETLNKSFKPDEYSPHRNWLMNKIGNATISLSRLLNKKDPEAQEKFEEIINKHFTSGNNPDFGSQMSSAVGQYWVDSLKILFENDPEAYANYLTGKEVEGLGSLSNKSEIVKNKMMANWPKFYDQQLENESIQKAQDLVNAGLYMALGNEEEIDKFKQEWEKANPDQDFYKSDAAGKLASEYSEMMMNVQWSPKINNDGYREIDKSHTGKSKGDRVLTDLKNSAPSLTFFDPETGETFNHTDKKYENYIGEIDNIKSVMGELDSRNYYTADMASSVNTAAFASPYAITVENEAGESRVFYVAKQTSDLNSPQEQRNGDVNKVYNVFNRNPYLYRKSEISGIPIEARFIPNDPTSNQDGQYQVRLPGGKSVTVNNMNELLMTIDKMKKSN